MHPDHIHLPIPSFPHFYPCNIPKSKIKLKIKTKAKNRNMSKHAKTKNLSAWKL